MDSKKMTMISVGVFVLSLLVFIATVVLVFFKPQENASAKKTKSLKTINVEIGDVATQIGSYGKYYKGFVYLEVIGKKTPAKIEEKKPQIVDTILSIISGSDIKNVTGNLDVVKEEIRLKINEILDEDLVVDVLFTESIVQ